MFERYTEHARRIIFFARYEASQFGSPYIETEHLLLGLLREDKATAHKFLHGQAPVESIRKQIEDVTMRREKVSTAVDLPLSNECKRVLAYAAEEAEALSDKHIGPEHMLLGLLREEKSLAAQLLQERGVRLRIVREELAKKSFEESGITLRAARELGVLADFSTPLTRLAQEERLLPLVGREKELLQLAHGLGRSGKNNAVLVGQAGAGKRTIMEGLAQRVAESTAPAFLEDKTFVAIDLAMLAAAAQHSAKAKEFLATARAEMVRGGGNTLYCFDELHALLAGPAEGAHTITVLLKAALLGGKVRCIAAATPEEHDAATRKARWLEQCFFPVEVRPATRAETVMVLQGVQKRFEKFHSVQYSEDALKAAAAYSDGLVKNRCLPDKAIDLIDDAGAFVKMKYETTALPEEIIAARKRLKFIIQREENAIANHEFEKARFYSDEKRQEQEKLVELNKKHNLQQEHVGIVTEEDIAEALARWTGVPVAEIRAMPAGIDEQGEKPRAASRRKKSS
jgi:ATP-dependent Clp protease ATP-binding subunit ClpC